MNQATTEAIGSAGAVAAVGAAPSAQPRADPGGRIAAGAVALLAWTLLLAAAVLAPSPGGLGTHTELGLAPCHFYVITGEPCPTCGMTTAFSAVVHGELVEALRAQVFGTVLALACLLTGLGATLTAATGISLGLVRQRIFFGSAWVWAVALLAVAGWAIKAAVMR